MNFYKLPRSYCTPDGCRLATYEEARNGLETIKEKGLLEKWERARLLDGWISGPGYDFQMGNDYRWCMAFMLITKLDAQDNIASGILYKDITLSKDQKEVALLLCREDWNYEVVYWVLNSLSGSETMDPADVAHGNIPFYNSAKFKTRNIFIHDIAQKFVEEGPAAEKAKKRKFSDPNSVREVLSGMIGFLKEKERRTMKLWKCSMDTILDSRLERLTDMSLGSTWIGDVAYQGGVTWEAIADVFWNFLSESFVLSTVNKFRIFGISDICRFTNKWDRDAVTRSQGNFIFASHVLLHMSRFGDEIIYSPVQENGEFNPAKFILCYASEKVEQQPERLNKMLQDNALGRCYEESGNYEVLDKLLIIASKRRDLYQRGQKVDIFVINRLLECGAKPGRSLRSRNSKTALHYAAKFEDEKVAKCLLEKCDTNQRVSFVNAQDNKQRTALHRATELGTKPLCELLHSYGARLDVQDKWGKTVLDIAVRDGNEEIIDLFAQLACKSDKPEAYFTNVHLGHLLRQSLLKGYVQMVRVLINNGEKLPGDDDDHGITTLHLAAMCENEKAAKEMVDMILLANISMASQLENFINAQDKIGKTALHRATELGNKPLCELLLSYGARLDARDREGQTVLDSAVRDGNEEIIDLFAPLVCKSDKPEAYFINLSQLLRQSLLKGYVEIVRMLLNKGEEQLGDDDDDQGRTMLHLAAMCENEELAKEMVDMILAESEDKGISVAKLDGRGRTVLHEAALKGHASLCKDLLDLNPNLINVKDKYGRNALYDAVQGKLDNINAWKTMYGAYKKKGGKLDDLIDISGVTPLHVAAEQGRRKILKHLLTRENVERADFPGQMAYHRAAKLGDRDTVDIMKQADFLGQTALHKAVRSGDKGTVEILLDNGANPFEERDCDGRTALHYVVEIAETGKAGKELAELLLDKCKSEKEKLLFLWASAAGVGPADQNLTDPELKDFLLKQKILLKEILLDKKPYNLLQIAASIGSTGMTKELLSRGFQIGDIQNEEWQDKLTPEEKREVKRVSTELKKIAEQGNDQPTMQDNLERRDYAHGLAALLLNPFLKPPITVGISGDWGKGKSSVMIPTERILLETVSQLAILPSPQLSRSTSDFPGVKVLKLSKEGEKRAREIKSQLDLRGGGLIAAATSEAQDADALVEFLRKFLSNYEPKYRPIFKALAVMDSTKMLCEEETKTLATERSVPAIITVQYNAWKYRNETEALAGLAVEITKEIECSMTDPQWLSTCFRNAWRKHKHSIWIEIIFPCLLAILLAGSFIWIVWLVFEKYKLEEWAKAKYACVPAAIVVVVWILAKSVMGILKPVSTQLMNYISFPDHADKLGYQDRVISDINFLKDEIGKKPSMRCTAMVILWHLVVTLWFAALYSLPKCFAALSSFPKCLRNPRTNMKCRPADFLKICSASVKLLQLVISLKLWFAIFYFFRNFLGSAGTNIKFPPAPSKDLRIIVFVDDLDRCQESVILQVLAAINLVLAVCEINVVLGMDKGLIERAITKKHGDSKSKSSKLADNYLQKIIQLPLDLPDPSEKQLTKFLESHMGLKASGPDRMSTEPNISDTTIHGIDDEDQPRFHAPPASSVAIDVGTPREEREIKGVTGTEEGTGARQTPSQPREANTSDEQNMDKTDHCSCSTIFQRITVTKRIKKIPPKEVEQNTNKTGNNPISIREMLFVTYSAGEWDAICHFKKFATDCRKLPREWKRFLNYHRLVWNILSINVAEKPLVGWQVQLISWIFICWEWKENMDILIQDWLNVGVLKSLKSEKPSLGRIVEHFIEECGSNNENRKGKDEINNGVAKAEQTNKDTKIEQTSLQRDADQMVQDRQKKESSLDQPEVQKKGELEAIKEQLNSLEKSMVELKNTINELKLGQGTKQVTPKNETRVDGNKIKQKDMRNWMRLRSALNKYDVTMDGIEAFQRFRFHCVPGHLQCPLPNQEWEVK